MAIVAILFAQTALAAFACPALTQAAQAAAMDLPCDQMDMQAPPLCQKHCADEEQKPHDGSPAALPGFVPAFTVRLSVTSPASRIAWQDDLVPSAAPPPLTIRNCCFRI